MNPLLQKYEELHKKKEEPKEITNVPPPKEALEACEPYLSTTCGTSGIGSALISSNFITTSNQTALISTPNIRTFSSYDLYSINQSFLEIADKIKMNKAQVTNMEVTFDARFGCNMKKLIFSVEVEDTP